MHKIINEFINKMNESTSTNDKVDLIKDYIYKHKEIQKLLYYTYNNFMQYNVTPKILDKKSSLINKHTIFQKDKDLFSLLDSLNQKMFTGHNAIKEVNGFIHHNKQLKDILYLVLNRNLKIRVSSKLVNKASPGLIPEFNVALANKYDEKTKKKISFQNDTWFISRKLDGVRCIIVVDEKGKAKSFSRAGKQFHTLSLVEKEIESLGIKNVVYDGEMCIVDDNNNEDFQRIMKEISRKNHTITNGLFQVFDFIPYRMFSKGYGEAGNLSQRLTTLQTLLINKPLLYLDYLEHTPITTFEELHKLRDIAIQKGWEGLMLRKNTVYKGKRSNDILKVKTFHDSEYRVE